MQLYGSDCLARLFIEDLTRGLMSPSNIRPLLLSGGAELQDGRQSRQQDGEVQLCIVVLNATSSPCAAVIVSRGSSVLLLQVRGELQQLVRVPGSFRTAADRPGSAALSGVRGVPAGQ